MLHRHVTDWDDAYANGVHIAGGEDYPPRWAAAAAAFRARVPPETVTYGEGARQVLDLFRPEGRADGLVVFVHGGYWMEFGRESWSHLAAGPLARGWAVAMPSYTLAPEMRVGGIVREIGQAVAAVAGLAPGPLRLAGHSAGGHLVTRMVCADSPLGADIRGRIGHVMSISGVHDLRPLLATAMAGPLRLDAAEAAAESPALKAPVPGTRLTCWAGAAERAEFLRQNALLANIWTGLGASCACVEEPDRHHFDVIDGLADPDSAMVRTLLE